MPFYDSEAIERARQVDLLTYLQTCEPQELVHVSGNVYCTKEHDSLRISNGKWCWFSQGFGGYSALDYLIKVKGCSFMEAMEAVAGRGAVPPPKSPSRAPVPREEKPRHLLLPPPAPDNRAMLQYLAGRGIDQEILDYCVQTGRIYESRNKGHSNVVFVGFDKDGKARFGCLRGISEARFHGDVSGSDKHYSFSIPGNSQTVHVFESAIDALSYATLELFEGRNWREDHLLSLAGVFVTKRENVVPVALSRYLADHPEIRTLRLHLDNDAIGRGAVAGIIGGLRDRYEIWDEPPRCGKDVNDQLKIRVGLKKKEEYSR